MPHSLIGDPKAAQGAIELAGGPTKDLRPLLKTRLEELERQQRELLQRRAELEESLTMLQKDIETIRDMASLESRRLGDREPLIETSDLRFLSMRLSDIAEEFIVENRSKTEMMNRLQVINYPFQKSDHGRAVHFAWVNARRRQDKR
ncbi:MAG: hypothetical protein J4G01_04760 [Dehalococcoidia bacterium]|nr:hypothetical protein [Dehalococcoidia bacterium]